ncbi:acetyltransferase [Elizabethkingia miricola]|nr:acetyltransferase [Elizabethkingia miricola]
MLYMENLKFEKVQSQNGGFISAFNQNNEEIGKLTYTIQPEKSILIISYVMVFPKHEGNGYGQMLVTEAINFARENHWKIYPHCSFSRSVLVNMKDISDVYP